MMQQNEAFETVLKAMKDDAKTCNYRARNRDGLTKDSAEGHQERIRQVEQYIRDNPGSLTPEIARKMLKLGISKSSVDNILTKLLAARMIRREFRTQDVLPYRYAVYFPRRA
jgi:hypothetical protein